MDLYSQKAKSIPQKTALVLIQVILIGLSYLILFNGDTIPFLGNWLLPPTRADIARKYLMLIFSCIVSLRINYMMLVMLKRKMPWQEAISVPFAFAVYYLGFPLFANGHGAGPDAFDTIGIILFAIGSFLNTAAETQRYLFKRKPENMGRLYTRGLFGLAMHINYFGDILWVAGYALVSHNVFAATVPLVLAAFFVFYNIPLLDKHLRENYKAEFPAYAAKTRKLIPFIY